VNLVGLFKVQLFAWRETKPMMDTAGV
jgi:hypothetical protein